MKNLSEFIPLLIILAAIAFSYIKSPKKKEEEKGKSFPMPNPPVFPDFSGDKNKTQKPATSAGLKEKLNTIRNVNPEKANKPSRIHSGNPSGSGISRTPPILVEEENPEPFIDTSNQDEVKKAIIYAEIFTRKEY